MLAFGRDRNGNNFPFFRRGNYNVQVRFFVFRIASVKCVSTGEHLSHIR